ncbi:hypothetical protein B0G84_3241 [Paraburkholderia sp. BL8N3]|nr:hypothetical protein [Paraburkholderia sp. BL8N3]TCK37943.1 hypothetical protein B0G84_3241 [Paraburkholderia sp. BL8N3]
MTEHKLIERRDDTTTKEAKDLQIGDVHIHAGMVRYRVIAVTPIDNGGYVEIHSEQVGKPDDVRVATVPAHTRFEVAL